MRRGEVLVVARPPEAERLRQAALAAGHPARALSPAEELTGSARPGAILFAADGDAGEAADVVQRLRRAAGAIPVLAFADAAAAEALGPLVDVFVARPAPAATVIARVTALLARTAAEAARGEANPSTDRGALLRRLEAGIDEIIEGEMATAVRATSAPRGGLAAALEAVVDASAAADIIVGPPTDGDLTETDLPSLVGKAFSEGATGRLAVRHQGNERLFYFEAGRPVLSASNATEDRLVFMLLRLGRITTAQMEQAVRAADETGRRMGALLVDLGILKTSELLPFVRRHYEEVLLSTLSWETGRWRFDAGVVASAERTRLLRHPAALVRQAVARDFRRDRVVARLGSGKNVFRLEASAHAAEVLAAIAENDGEKGIAVLFDGVRPLDEVVRTSGVPEPLIHDMAFTLAAFGVLRATPSGARAARASRPPRGDQEIDRQRLVARYRLAQEGDYFQVLGVERQADPSEIRRAYSRIGDELDPDRVGVELCHALADELATIRQVLDEALRVLATPALRDAYVAALESTRAAAGEPAAS